MSLYASEIEGPGDEPREGLVVRSSAEYIETTVSQVADARGEDEAKKVTESEDMLRGPSGVRIMLPDLQAGIMIEEARRPVLDIPSRQRGASPRPPGVQVDAHVGSLRAWRKR